jgi:hypothetical protein
MIIRKNAHTETENLYKGHLNQDGLGRIPGFVEGHPVNEV